MLEINIDDSPEEDLAQYFDQCFQFIDSNSDGGTLVHCVSGISRSSSVVIAYLMAKNEWKFQESWQYVKSRRQEVYPNSGF